ncbi:hypothetical protein DZA28_27635 [Pseudomonas alloputida]|uniref:Uncharacterized protein n=1 Tax=Pseudomonas alloputida TaxID=1940621 RepID=A0ABY3DCU6_9PSED|nr:hypothetical protein DZA28_27635 [Pseudomonas alloputida]
MARCLVGSGLVSRKGRKAAPEFQCDGIACRGCFAALSRHKAPTGAAHHLSCAPAPIDACPLPALAFHPAGHGSLPGKSPACHHRA